jgi:hypothetical protein
MLIKLTSLDKIKYIVTDKRHESIFNSTNLEEIICEYQ